MKILVAIANYGTQNDQYLRQLLAEYRSMSHQVDIVVLSNLHKGFGEEVEIHVELPSKNPWSLPFAHQQIFATRLDNYDLFIYSEDDHLITQRNIDAFLEITKVLPENEIAGFLASEQNTEGKVSFPGIHGPYHWDPFSVRSRGPYIVASFTNEHSASYMLTQPQLRRAIASGGFLVGPHEGKYDLLCTAATDVYTQCGFRKVVCISHLEDFVVRHLPNKYVGKLGMCEADLWCQIRALREIAEGRRPPVRLVDTEARPRGSRWWKDFHEPVRKDIVSLVPSEAQSVLSLGCGCGATEEWLLNMGLRVVGAPLDSVIGALTESKGVEVAYGDLKAVRESLTGRQFDCILFTGVLHLAQDPAGALASFADLLSRNGLIILTVPNHNRVRALWRWVRGEFDLGGNGASERAGSQLLTRKAVFDWIRRSALRAKAASGPIPDGAQLLNRITLGTARPFLESEIVVSASRS